MSRNTVPSLSPRSAPSRLRTAAGLAVILSALYLTSCSVQSNGPAAESPGAGPAAGAAAARPEAPAAPSKPVPVEAPAAAVGQAAQPSTAAKEGAAPSPTPPPPVIKELEAKLKAGAPADPDPAAGVEAAGPEEEKKFLAELESAVKAWVADLDADKDEETLSRLAVTRSDLESTIAPGHRNILLGTLLAKNRDVLKTLAEAARGADVKILRWAPGKVAHTGSATGLFLKSVPLVSSNLLEIQLGKFPVELELRQAMKLDGTTWKVMEFSVKH